MAPAPPPDLRYIAEDGHTGYTIAAARLVEALRGSGLDVELLAWTLTHLSGRGDTTRHSRDRAPRPPGGGRSRPQTPTVMHLVPEHLERVRTLATGPLAVHTVWETDRLPSHWPALLERADGVIVPTEWNREVFAASGVTRPIEVIPHVAAPPPPATAPPPLELPAELVVFYTVSRWDERKAPALAVEAYLEAFTAADPVVLVIKTGPLAEVRPPDGWGQGSARFLATDWQVARLLRRHPRPPRIHLLVEEWDDAQIAALHARADCYLTLTHGEGWGIGSFDACLHGNPVIATGWGGHLDYLQGSPLLVDHDLVPVSHNAAGSYEPSQRWAQPRREHAVELLRAVAADPAGARAAAAPLRERARMRYSPEAVAERFAQSARRLGLA